jgi:hypothetical protein
MLLVGIAAAAAGALAGVVATGGCLAGLPGCYPGARAVEDSALSGWLATRHAGADPIRLAARRAGARGAEAT